MRVGFIGAGSLAQALVRAVAGNEAFPGNQIWITDRSGQRAPALAHELSLHYEDDNEAVAAAVQVLIVAVKPAQMHAVLSQIASRLSPGTTVVSVAAGFSLSAIEQALWEGNEGALPPQVSWVRAMPNVNALVGASMTAVSSDSVPKEVLAQVVEVFTCVGEVITLPESDFAIFAALAGCSPAWFYTVIDALARAGVKHGLPKALATKVVTQAMLGSAKLVQQEAGSGGASPQDLVDRVTSPGGTTIAGLLAAQEAGLASALVKAVDAAVARDEELSKRR